MPDRIESIGAAFERPVIVVTGFMGAGKTTVGKALSGMLGLDFVDTDTEIAAAEGLAVSGIFEQRGEAHFRNLERSFCFSLEKRRGVVIATGGGTLIDQSVFDLFSRMGRIVLLEAAPEVLSARIARSGGRALLAASRFPDAAASLEDRVRALLDARENVYDRIPFRVDTSSLDPSETAEKIAASLDLPCHSMELSLIPGARAPSEKNSETPLRGRSGTAHIDIGRGSLFKLGARLREFGIGSKVFFLTTPKIGDLFLPRLAASLAREEIPYSVVTIDDGDSRKNLAQAEEIVDKLIAEGARRDATFVPVGGGVTGDIGGFVASIFMRGVPLVHVPTTLLAQVDSSVGGKVGVNHRLSKNLMGSFYQPHAVLIDPCALDTLPLGEIANGMAEVVKSALIGSAPFFDYLESHTRDRPEIRLRDIGFLETCVLESTKIKARIVTADPFERDLRRTLNLGHTVGHAIEASASYRGMKHGEAVSVGMMSALRIARARGLVEKRLVNRTKAILEWCGLPVRLERFDMESVRESIRVDKKIRKGRIHYVLPTSLGSAVVVDDVSEEEIIGTLEKGAS
jgi:3-dehydroquinate synthase